MLINLRNALMAGKRLPYDAEVEYLESTGTQWIDTGISGAEHNLIITAGVRINTYGAYAGIFGNYVSETANSFRLLLTESNNGKAYANCGYRTNNSHIIDRFSLRNWHTVILNGAEDRCFCDGVEITKGNRYIQGTANANTIRIFTSGGAAAGTWSKQVSAFKMELNGVLVRDFIPVRKGTVGYLYDRVSGKLFGNAGTGAFVLGQDVVPVEYIESHGTEYIDTGVPARTGLATDIVCAITQAQNDTAVCGAKGTSNNRCVPVAFFSSDSTTALVYGNGNRNTDSIYAQYYPEVGRMVRYQSEISTGAISLNIDGTAYTRTTQTSTINAGTTLRMFAREWNGTISAYSKIRMASALFDLDGERVRKYLPVRVGTGSTWEGAMIDTLTRRIYRNAGTGAFTYGNDLKYPIPAE